VRVSRLRAPRRIRLSDGVIVERGDVVLDIHFWNERLPGASGSLAFGGRFGRRLARSFLRLARAMEHDSRIADAVAVRGRLAFAEARSREEMTRFGAWFGFESVDAARPSLGLVLHDLFEDLWLVMLTWAFNPSTLRGRSFRRRREDLWISRPRMIEHYLGKGRRARA